MNKNILLILFFIFYFLFPSITQGADKIHGNACYTYGDNESLVQAEQTTKTLAIRNALESYSIFIRSTTQVTDVQLSSDLINTVKQIKILKHLQSGRKLCYTVEGYVEPQDLKVAIKYYLKNKQKSTNLRLQENDWIKIIDTHYYESSEEEIYKQVMKPKNGLCPEWMKGRILKQLGVKIQFKQYCKATTKVSPSEEVMNDSRATGEQIGAAFGKWIENLEVLEYGYKYRCDYRTTVLATYYDKGGSEIKTESIIPMGERQNLSGKKEWKFEILPGETVMVPFIVPEDAVTWEVWVPK